MIRDWKIINTNRRICEAITITHCRNFDTGIICRRIFGKRENLWKLSKNFQLHGLSVSEDLSLLHEKLKSLLLNGVLAKIPELNFFQILQLLTKSSESSCKISKKNTCSTKSSTITNCGNWSPVRKTVCTKILAATNRFLQDFTLTLVHLYILYPCAELLLSFHFQRLLTPSSMNTPWVYYPWWYGLLYVCMYRSLHRPPGTHQLHQYRTDGEAHRGQI